MRNGMANDGKRWPASDEVVCTLYEGDFHLGVAVLINSIVRSGFRGLFWVGNRGGLPPWTSQLSCREDGLFQVGEALLGFETIENHRHFGQFKPEFLIDTIAKGIAREHIWYFDPDITVRCEWTFFERWVCHGVCLCQEFTMGAMASDHPLRCEWIDLACAAGWGAPIRQQERYYNSGFVGLHVKHMGFLESWQAAVRLANATGVEHDQFQKGSRVQTFYTVDQDAMNISAMYSEAPLSTVGAEGMGWITGGFIMYHTLGHKKAWRKRFLHSALEGDPPVDGDKHFLRYAGGPIRPYTAWQLKRKRWSIQWATLIGRFFRRT
jgi:hypothetical protein